jgi:hypothetical protein
MYISLCRASVNELSIVLVRITNLFMIIITAIPSAEDNLVVCFLTDCPRIIVTGKFQKYKRYVLDVVVVDFRTSVTLPICRVDQKGPCLTDVTVAITR